MSSRITGATTATTSTRQKLDAWLLHHRQVLTATLRELLTSPLASGMTWLMIGIALALPTILYVLLAGLSDLSGDWGGKPRISVYLSEVIEDTAAISLAEEIGNIQGVETSVFISRTSALEEFQQKAGFGDVLASLDQNPLPHLIEVVPNSADPARLVPLVNRLEVRPGVDDVMVDLEWLERLFALLTFAERLVAALALVLGAGVVLVMGNTIRLAIMNRRQEIEIIKLVGGTDGFVRRPFLYLGFWYGLGGAIMALILAQTSVWFLSSPVAQLAQSYRNEFTLNGPGLYGALLLLSLGSALGILGATLAVSRHLSDIEPR